MEIRMSRSKQEVFNELYERFEAGMPIPVDLQEEAHNHGIRVESVEDAALSSLEEVDCDDE
ncbi:hypothetical protein PV_001 (endogenous virus) [Gutovirus Vc1]|uniref:Uncharacterized protein n=1 Tax=Vibrio phage Vc1 TaxID=1480731 RepID=X2KPJ1_9CAUD|nr:hypothetical protein HOQ97_gp01 [Vibrio phage Vc1]AHN84652.1 hypothetical protein PV_001 [Vibrio phage Vc1]